MGLGACGGGIGEDCGEGLAILLRSKGSSLSKDHFLKVTIKCKRENLFCILSQLSRRDMRNLISLNHYILNRCKRRTLQFNHFK